MKFLWSATSLLISVELIQIHHRWQNSFHIDSFKATIGFTRKWSFYVFKPLHEEWIIPDPKRVVRRTLIVYRSKYPVEPLKNCSRSSLWHVSNPPRSQWANVKEPEHLYLNSEAISSMALWRQSMIGLSFYIKDYEDIWIQGS